MYSKNKRYPANDALKKGSPSTIESACRKPDICLAYVIKRDKYIALKTEYQKSQVKLEQMEQLKKDNGSKLMLINKLNTTITEMKDNIRVGNNPQFIKNLQNANAELRGQLEKLKEKPPEDRFDMLRTQAKEITKLQDELTELRKTLHSERDKFFTICNKDNEEIKRLKDANCDAEQMKKLRDEHTQYRMEIDKLKGDLHLTKSSHKRLTEENTLLKEEHGELTQKQENYHKLITEMFDSL